MNRIKHAVLFRAMSLILVVTFAAVDISYAYGSGYDPGNSTLAVPSVMQEQPMSVTATDLRQSVFKESVLLASACEIGEIFFGDPTLGKVGHPEKYVDDAVIADLGAKFRDSGIKLLNIVPVEYLMLTAPEKLREALDAIGFKGTLPTEGVIFVLYERSGKKLLAQIALRDKVSSNSLPGYELTGSSRYMVKYINEGFRVREEGEKATQVTPAEIASTVEQAPTPTKPTDRTLLSIEPFSILAAASLASASGKDGYVTVFCALLVIGFLGGFLIIGRIFFPVSWHLGFGDRANNYNEKKLTALGSRAVPALIARIGKVSEVSYDQDKRVVAIKVIGNIGPAAKAAGPCLMAVMTNHRESNSAREAAAEALYKIGLRPVSLADKVTFMRFRSDWDGLAAAGPAAVPSLITALSNEDDPVRLKAIETIGKIGPAAKAAVPSLITASGRWGTMEWKDDVIIAVAKALGKIGPAAKEAVPRLRKILEENVRGDSQAKWRKIEVAEALIKIDPEEANYLMRSLLDSSGDFHRRNAAAETLIKLRLTNKNVFPCFMKAIEGEETHMSVFSVLVGIGPAAWPVIPSLLKRLKKDYANRGYWRDDIRKILGNIDPDAKAAVPALIEGLNSGLDIVGICKALGNIGPAAKDAVPSLTRKLNGAMENDIESISEALGKIGPAAAEAIPALTKAELSLGNVSVRRDNSIARSIRRTLRRIAPNAIARLITAMKDKNLLLEERRECVKDLSEYGLVVVPDLITALGDSELSDEVRHALVKIGPDAIKLLSEAAIDPNVDRHAQDLARIIRGDIESAASRENATKPARSKKLNSFEPFSILIAASLDSSGVGELAEWAMQHWFLSGIIGVAAFFIAWRIFFPVSRHLWRLGSIGSAAGEAGSGLAESGGGGTAVNGPVSPGTGGLIVRTGSVENEVIPAVVQPPPVAGGSLPAGERPAAKLFEIVEEAANSRRKEFAKEAGQVISAVSSNAKGGFVSDDSMFGKDKASLALTLEVERALAAMDSMEASSFSEDIATKAAELKKNLKQFTADGGVASLIVLARNAKRENQKLIIGLETDWIPEAKNVTSLQHNAISALTREINSIGATLRLMGLDNVEIIQGGKDQLAKAVLDRAGATGTKMKNIVVMASIDTIGSDSFKAFNEADDKDRPFIAGVDPRTLLELYKEHGEDVEKQLYVKFAELLYLTLELAAGKEPPMSSVIVSFDKNKRLLILLPNADIMSYEKLRETYLTDKRTLVAA